MIFEHDIHVPHRGGLWLSANIYRPDNSERKPVPVIVSLGPYNKERHTTEVEPFESRLLMRQGPTVVYERFEGEQWVGFGYSVVHLDCPGIGLSPGKMDVFSIRDLEFYYDAIEWLAKQTWCDGQVASCGLSYHSYTSVGVATLNPPSLKAIIAWEVGVDMYRDQCYPGGVRNNVFIDWWFETWVRSQQRGLSVRSNEDLLADFVDFPQVARDHPHNDDFWKNNTPSMENIKVPFYTVANICDHPISTNSHFRLMDEARTPKDKQWLEIIAGKHVPPMYEAENVRSQRRFLDYILKDADNGWNKVPRVKYALRGRYGFKSFTYTAQWPPTETQTTTFGLDASTPAQMEHKFSTLATAGQPSFSLRESNPQSLATGVAQYHNEGDKMMFNTGFPYANYVKHLTLEEKRAGSAVSFVTAPFERATLVAGQAIAKLFVSVNGATDTDIFLALRYLSKDGHEILFEGILDSPSLPVATGCIRLSKRRVDDKISHGDFIYIDGSKVEPVEEGRIVETCLMLSPISVVIEKGGRLLLEISSRSIENVFPYVQCDPNDRKMGGNVSIHTGGNHGSALTLPCQSMEVCGMAEGV